MAKSLFIPEGYKSALTLRETQHAIKYIKDLSAGSVLLASIYAIVIGCMVLGGVLR